MNSKNLLTPRPKSPYELDPNSDRYRVCKNDGVEFMASHRSTIFCNPKCADEFHNEKKRLAAEKQIQDEIDLALKASALEVQRDKTIEPKETIHSEATFVTSPLVGNINLIGATLGNRESLKVYKKYLTDKGLDYSVYDNKYQMPGTELNVLTYGPYAIAWGYENHIILTYKKNIPWIQ
jgi:hypothetical protein